MAKLTRLGRCGNRVPLGVGRRRGVPEGRSVAKTEWRENFVANEMVCRLHAPAVRLCIRNARVSVWTCCLKSLNPERNIVREVHRDTVFSRGAQFWLIVKLNNVASPEDTESPNACTTSARLAEHDLHPKGSPKYEYPHNATKKARHVSHKQKTISPPLPTAQRNLLKAQLPRDSNSLNLAVAPSAQIQFATSRKYSNIFSQPEKIVDWPNRIGQLGSTIIYFYWSNDSQCVSKSRRFRRFSTATSARAC